jgi:D-alanine-D-alanine ligase-like ATP-grasp enzyme
LNDGPFLLRVSDPEMLRLSDELTRAGIAYYGPRAAVMQRCYDKLQATRLAEAAGIACPRTLAGDAATELDFPVIVKPRRSSDSIGLRLQRKGPLPQRYRMPDYIVQEYVRGREITVALIGIRIGQPLELALPAGATHSFARKYLRRPRRQPVQDAALAARVRETALELAQRFAVNWAARVDFISEPGGRLCFLECDVAPMIARGSAFAASLGAAGIERAEQLGLLTT